MKKLIPVFQQKAEEMTTFIERKMKENGSNNLEGSYAITQYIEMVY